MYPVMNPADLSSRDCSPMQLVQSNWWLGPSWLYKSETHWPVLKNNFNEEEIESEIKRSTLVHVVNAGIPTFKVRDHFSCYNKLLRFLAWMNRFFANRRKIIDRKKEADNNTRISYYSVFI